MRIQYIHKVMQHMQQSMYSSYVVKQYMFCGSILRNSNSVGNICSSEGKLRLK